MKIHRMGAELFHADRQTDMTKLIVALRNFANAPKDQHVHVKIMWVCYVIKVLNLHFSVTIFDRLQWDVLRGTFRDIQYIVLKTSLKMVTKIGRNM